MPIDDIDDFDGIDDENFGESNNSPNRESSTDTRDGSEPQKDVRYGQVHRSTVQLTQEQLDGDWYTVLGVPRQATFQEIKNAYHKRCLETHPDKQEKVGDDSAFKEVVKAFAVLGNTDLRRAYDSSGTFDDSIPDDKNYEAAEFFEIFGPVFRRNERWSTKQMPPLGDISTPVDDVDRFYRAWNSFKSWRDFSHMVEPVECDDGECREIRRRIQRDRERQVDKLKTKESRRVSTLVERAFRLDPRMKLKRQQELEEKQRQQNEREHARLKALEEEKKKKAEEEEKRKELEEAEKAAKKALANRTRELRATVLRQLREFGCLDESADDSMVLEDERIRIGNVKWILSAVDNLQELVSKLESIGLENRNEAVPYMNSLILDTERMKGIDRYGNSLISDAIKSGNPDARGALKEDAGVWTPNDLQLLQKAISKYPSGTVDRWEKMGHFINSSHTCRQILLKTRELEASWGILRNAISTSSLNPAPTSEEVAAWTAAQQRQLETGLRELINYKEKDKWDKIADMVEGKSKADCIARYKVLCNLKKK